MTDFEKNDLVRHKYSGRLARYEGPGLPDEIQVQVVTTGVSYENRDWSRWLEIDAELVAKIWTGVKAQAVAPWSVSVSGQLTWDSFLESYVVGNRKVDPTTIVPGFYVGQRLTGQAYAFNQARTGTYVGPCEGTDHSRVKLPSGNTICLLNAVPAAEEFQIGDLLSGTGVNTGDTRVGTFVRTVSEGGETHYELSTDQGFKYVRNPIKLKAPLPIPEPEGRRPVFKSGDRVSGVAPRAKLLADASALISGDRESEYGTPQENFKRIADLWNTLFKTQLFTPAKVALAMAGVKLARMANSTSEDSWKDLAGYAALGFELDETLMEEK